MIEDSKRDVTDLKTEINQHLKNIDVDTVKEIGKEKWDSVVKNVKEETEKLEKNYQDKVEKVQDIYQSLTKKVDETIHGGSFSHAIMKCGGCGKEFSFDEFLDLFDHEHNLALPNEDHFNDGDMEEFYEGWAIWANHYKLRCPSCEASKWTDVIIKDGEKKDEL
eukprot:TRINITY_DN6818_c0_g1_i1.p1 TRINITY_DN6818_c0_g1~~TRINITY_DN6818_c0_g1_i1.p1  ORF type:complete len:164 (-),score=57.95 TRINITY_DN6818_c0_g1_i1:19-510(-)